MLNHQRRLTLPRPTTAPTATQLRVVLTLHALPLQPLGEPENGPEPQPEPEATQGRKADIREPRFSDQRGGKGWGAHWGGLADSDPPYVNPTTKYARMLHARGVSSFHDFNDFKTYK